MKATNYRMKGMTGAAVAVAVCAMWAAPSAAILTKCKAKINNKDGAVLVQANDVTGMLLWGSESGKELYPVFDNSGKCSGDKPRKCELGAAETPERLYPPEGCVLYLKDTGDASTCAAYVKKCSPGRRPCASDMVAMGGICIDKYEASVWDSPTGLTQYGTAANDYPCANTGQDCTNIYARSVAGVTPSAYITWFQAQQACHNVGKRLATNAEWQQAVAGTPDPGPDNGTTDCNTNSTFAVAATGSRSACVSTGGAFDMVGNLSEWVADWVPRSTACPGWGTFSATGDAMCLSGASTTSLGPGALVRGGNFGAATDAGPLFVFGDFGPSDWSPSFGFRCAR